MRRGDFPRERAFPARAWDSGVFTELAWIQQETGTDLGGEFCGGEPAVGDPEVAVLTSEGCIDEQTQWMTQSIVVRPGASRVRIGLATAATVKLLARLVCR